MKIVYTLRCTGTFKPASDLPEGATLPKSDASPQRTTGGLSLFGFHKMAKRRFDSTRAYKLAKTIVIIVSVVFGLMGREQLHNVFDGTYSLNRISGYCSGPKAEDGCQTYFIVYGDYSKADQLCSGTGAKTFCKSYYYLLRRDLENSGWRNLGMATALLVVFFGGAWLYKYLFPAQETRDNPDES